jgi:hypothetical protein
MRLRKKHKPPIDLNDIRRCGDFGGISEGKEIYCTRDPDHEGDHYSETAQAIYQWRNKKKTPA